MGGDIRPTPEILSVQPFKSYSSNPPIIISFSVNDSSRLCSGRTWPLLFIPLDFQLDATVEC